MVTRDGEREREAGVGRPQADKEARRARHVAEAHRLRAAHSLLPKERK